MRTRGLIWVMGWMAMGSAAQAQISANGVRYINSYKALAMQEEQRTGIPAAITLAQGLHESEAGTSELVRNSNNHFGIKCKADWKGPVYLHDDDARGECFRVYATAADSYRDHSDFLRQGARYASLFQLDPTDFEGWANGLRRAGYATNVRYSQILIKLIKDYHLEQYTLIALGKMSPGDEVVMMAPGGGNAGVVVAQATQPGGTDSSYPGGTDSSYPGGEFLINRTRVVYVAAGVSLLSVASKYDVPLGRLYEFNDMERVEVLARGQLVFLQRKRRKGSTEYHVVKTGEDLYGIAQAEGVRLTDLLEMNQLFPGAQPAAGERVYLQGSAPARPRLVGEAQASN